MACVLPLPRILAFWMNRVLMRALLRVLLHGFRPCACTPANMACCGCRVHADSTIARLAAQTHLALMKGLQPDSRAAAAQAVLASLQPGAFDRPSAEHSKPATRQQAQPGSLDAALYIQSGLHLLQHGASNSSPPLQQTIFDGIRGGGSALTQALLRHRMPVHRVCGLADDAIRFFSAKGGAQHGLFIGQHTATASLPSLGFSLPSCPHFLLFPLFMP